MSTFKNIALTSIEATTQTRKFFDETALKELADSISKQGVLQPILVRENGKKHQIIAGERRFRAAKLAGLKFIPCHVVEMDDTQALEAQITENLQRKDVHPMEEAHAFKRLLDEAKFTIEDIAAKVGKSTRYVAGRLKLIDLLPGFQQAFFADKMPAAGAVLIAASSKEMQEKYWQEDWENNWNDEDFYKSTNDIRDELNYMTDELNDAKFDITDANLVPSAGACTTCLKNTACFQLLFQEEGPGRCMNRECFENKTQVHKTILLKDIIENHPEYIFLPSRYYTDPKKIKQFNELGVEVSKWDAWEDVSEPKKPNIEDYDMEDDYGKDNYEDELAEYEADLKKYNEAIASGLVRKAFRIDENKVIEVIPKNAIGVEPGSIDETDPELANKVRLTGELKDLEEKHDRLESLQKEKMFTWASEKMREYSEDYVKRDSGLDHLEDCAMMLILFNKANYDVQKELSERDNFSRYENEEIYNWLANHATTDDHRIIMRSAILNSFSYGDPKGNAGSVAALLPIAEQVLGSSYIDAESELKSAHAKRKGTLLKQIADINKQLEVSN